MPQTIAYLLLFFFFKYHWCSDFFCLKSCCLLIDSPDQTQPSWNPCLKVRFPAVYLPCLFSLSLSFSPSSLLESFQKPTSLFICFILTVPYCTSSFFAYSAIFMLFCFSPFLLSHSYFIYHGAISANFSNYQFWRAECKNKKMTLPHLPLVLSNNHQVAHRIVFLITVVNTFTKLCSLNT